jgi:L-threonylcarbamoyladenylate synthase
MSPILRVDPARPDPAIIDEAAGILRAGGLVAFPTETVYGLGARAKDPHAVVRIFAAKGRPANHPVIAHVLGETDAAGLSASWGDRASRFARAFWPGPLTLIVPRAEHVPASLGGGTASLGVRAPRHPVARAILAALGEPIAAPSANRYQGLSPTRAEHVAASLGERVELIVDGGPCAEGVESTVLDLQGEVPRILRPGAIDLLALRGIDPRVVYGDAAPLAATKERASPGMDARHYAPRAPVTLAASRAEAMAEAELRAERGETVGVVVRAAGRDRGDARVVVVRLPEDPRGYAQALYATLHDLDARGVDAIVVEAVPEGDAWAAIADRLRRASAP